MNHCRTTDISGAIRFAEKWGLKIPRTMNAPHKKKTTHLTAEEIIDAIQEITESEKIYDLSNFRTDGAQKVEAITELIQEWKHS